MPLPPFARLRVEFARHEERRDQRVDGEPAGGGVAQVVGYWQKPSGVGHEVGLPGTPPKILAFVQTWPGHDFRCA